MHIPQLRNLRETIPKVMDSVLVDPPSPDQLHSNFSQAANGAAQSIKHFTQLVEDGKTKEVMEKGKESRMKDGEGITGWKVTEHEDWLNLKQEDGNNDDDDDDDDDGKEEESIVEVGDSPSMKNVNLVLDKFRSAHVGVEASLDEDSRTLTVGHLHGCLYFMLNPCKVYLPPPAQVNFEIQLNTTTEGHDIYRVDSKDKSKLHRAVLEIIRARPRPRDLNYLLVRLKLASSYQFLSNQILKEMLASYIDIKIRPCVKCSRLLDRNAQFPIIRSRKRTKQPDGRFASQWLALHTACI